LSHESRKREKKGTGGGGAQHPENITKTRGILEVTVWGGVGGNYEKKKKNLLPPKLHN